MLFPPKDSRYNPERHAVSCVVHKNYSQSLVSPCCPRAIGTSSSEAPGWELRCATWKLKPKPTRKETSGERAWKVRKRQQHLGGM